MRDVQFSASIDEHSYPLTGFVAFSCWLGHVFLVMSDEADFQVSSGTKSGSNMFM
jgi:hypothetical protein